MPHSPRTFWHSGVGLPEMVARREAACQLHARSEGRPRHARYRPHPGSSTELRQAQPPLPDRGHRARAAGSV